MFLSLGLILKLDWTYGYEIPLYHVYIPGIIYCRGVSAFETGCPCGV